MYYEINISKNGKHFFATSSWSITSTTALQTVYAVLAEKFPAAEGYELIVTQWSKIGTPIQM